VRNQDQDRTHAGWFASTHWSVLEVARSAPSPTARQALERLCRQYWSPLFNYARSRGCSKEDAEDLIQQFFAHFLGKELFGKADRERGRFRTFLLTALKNFLANEWQKRRAQKRGGGVQAVSIDEEPPNGGARLELRDERTAEHAFEYNWALALLAGVREKIAAEYLAAGRQDRFACLEQFLPGADAQMTYAEAAVKLGVAEGTIKSDVHRFKAHYGEVLRDEIGRTVATPLEVDEELRHLMTILSRAPH
jgi:RNA polymerase sigma factor (sigma-70 family)